MNTPLLRPLAFGEVLDGAFTLYRRNLRMFLLTTLIPIGLTVAASVLLLLVAIGGSGGGDAAGLTALMFTIVLVSVVGFGGMLVSWAALTHQTAQAYVAAPTDVRDGLRAGMQSLPRLVGMGIVWGIGVFVAIFAVILGGVAIFAITNSAGVLGMILGGVVVLAGYLAVFLGAFSVLGVAVPAVVVEGKGPLSALARAAELISGAFWRVVGISVVAAIICYLPMLVVMLVTGAGTAALTPGSTPATSSLVAQQVLTAAVNVLVTPFMAAVFTLSYFDRRVRTEALDVQMLSDRLGLSAGD